MWLFGIKVTRRRYRKPKTTFRRNINRKTMVAGGITRKGHAYALVHGRGRIGRTPVYAKGSIGTKGAIVGIGAGSGKRKISIDYNLTTKQTKIRSNILRKKE